METMTAVPRSSAAKRMTLANIVKGSVAKPLRLLLYGVDGVGKTTMAAGSESPVFIGVEDGTGRMDVPHYPVPQSWADVMDALDDLATSDHEYKTVVIDTLDWLEPMCWEHVCRGKRTKEGKPIESIEDIGFGKGYQAALDEWRIMCSKLDRLRARGMQSVLIAHSWIKPFKNPEGEDYDRFEIKLDKRASGLLREWADAVLFATHETHTYGKEKERKKGISTGARVVHTERQAAFDAKNRHNLPPTLPLDWQSLRDAITTGQPASPEVIKDRIAATLETTADEALKDRVRRAVMSASSDASALARIHNKLTAQLNITQQETGT